jgi:hypothetical protein
MVYFYLLNRINRNRWQPVFISDRELTKSIKIARRCLPRYKAEIANAGLLYLLTQETGRDAGTLYALDEEMAQKGAINGAKSNRLTAFNGAKRSQKKKEMAQKGAINGAKSNRLTAFNGAKRSQKKKEMAQKGAINGAKSNRLTASTHYNISKTYKDLNISTTKDNAREVDAVDVVEVDEVEILEAKKSPADLLREAQQKAADQGAEILKAIFCQERSEQINVQCMQLSVTPDQYHELAAEVIADWTQTGTTHDDFKGKFDYQAAARHLQNTIRKKAYAKKQQPKTRDQRRADLLKAAQAGLNQAISKDTLNNGGDPF